MDAHYQEQLERVRATLVSGAPFRYKDIRSMGIGHNVATRIRVLLEQSGEVIKVGSRYVVA